MATTRRTENNELAATVLTEEMYYRLAAPRRLKLTTILGEEPIGWYIGRIEDQLRSQGKRYFALSILAALDDIVSEHT